MEPNWKSQFVTKEQMERALEEMETKTKLGRWIQKFFRAWTFVRIRATTLSMKSRCSKPVVTSPYSPRG